MRVIIFGASGMVGQGVLRECLLASDVEQVLSVGRSAAGPVAPKLIELIHPLQAGFSGLEAKLHPFDACFYCLGVSAAGMSEAEYSKVNYEVTLDAASMLARLNPTMTFCYVSGAGADSSERGASMWARVRGRTENALLRLPFKACYLFRPGAIQPLHGIRSKTTSYRLFYSIVGPILPALRKFFPESILSTEIIGQAMLSVARNGAPAPILEAKQIYAASGHREK